MIRLIGWLRRFSNLTDNILRWSDIRTIILRLYDLCDQISAPSNGLGEKKVGWFRDSTTNIIGLLSTPRDNYYADSVVNNRPSRLRTYCNHVGIDSIRLLIYLCSILDYHCRISSCKSFHLSAYAS